MKTGQEGKEMASAGGSRASFQDMYQEESASGKLMKKAKDEPFVPIGIAGMIGALAYAGYTYKKRGKMSTSVFLMHTRVKAQGMIVGAMTLGVTYSLLKDYVFNKEKRDKYILGKPHQTSDDQKAWP